MKKISLLLPVVLIMTFLNAFPASGSDYPQPGDGAKTDGDKLVYMGWYQSNWEVFTKDTKTGEITRITNHPGAQAFPDIQGKYIVWQDNRGNPVTGSFDIYLYDTDSRSEMKISQTPGDHHEPLIQDGKVVWTDHDWGKKDLYLYDLTNGSQEKISSDGSQAFGLVFDGEAAAWVDFRHGGNDLYVYNIQRQQETRVTSGEDVNLYLVADGGKVAWAEKNQDYYQVKLLDSATNKVQTLTSGNSHSLPVAMSGQNILINNNGQALLVDIDSKTETPLQINISDPRSVTFNGNEIIWMEGGKVNSLPIPTANVFSGADNDKAPVKSEPILVRAQQQESVSSPDGQAVFLFGPGTFLKDTYITPVQEEYHIPGFIRISPVYYLSADEAMLQKFCKATVTYPLPAGQDHKKAALYQKINGKWLRLPFHRVSENVLSAEINSLLPLAVMIKQTGFKDTGGHWGGQYLEVMASQGIINGYSDNTFKPDRQITRAEFTAILAKSSGLLPDQSSGGGFNDVPESHWAASAISLARQQGWVGGYPGNLFLPDRPITREEMVSILVRYGGLTDVESDLLQDFQDNARVSGWARKVMNIAVARELVKGYNGRLRPGDNTTRAEAAVMFYQFLDRQNKL